MNAVNSMTDMIFPSNRVLGCNRHHAVRSSADRSTAIKDNDASYDRPVHRTETASAVALSFAICLLAPAANRSTAVATLRAVVGVGSRNRLDMTRGYKRTLTGANEVLGMRAGITS